MIQIKSLTKLIMTENNLVDKDYSMFRKNIKIVRWNSMSPNAYVKFHFETLEYSWNINEHRKGFSL